MQIMNSVRNYHPADKFGALHGGELRMLVVEDEPDVASTLKTLLERDFGAVVVIADNCGSARHWLADSPFDLLTLDYNLPDGNGLEFLEEITEREDAPPVVVVTGQGDELVAATSMKLGATRYVMKDRKLRTSFADAVEQALAAGLVKKAMREVEESENIYRGLIDILPEAVMIHVGGRVVLANPAAAGLVGAKSPEDLLGTNVLDLVSPEARKLATERMTRLEKGHDVPPFEEKLLRLDGSEVEVEVSTMRTKYRDVPALLTVARDLTANKQAEEALRRANVELQAYAHSVSNDLKGPLSAIIGAAILLEKLLAESIRDEEPPELHELAALLDKNANRAVGMVDDMLKLAEAGQRPTELSDVDLSDVVREIIEDRTAVIKERNIRVSVDPNLGHMRANRTQVQQVFANLIDNAIWHNTGEEPSIVVSYAGLDASGARHFLVIDNGPGIPPDELETMFATFRKGAATGKTGLGLYIVDKIARVYGGRVTASSDGGACFEVAMKDYPPA